MEQAISRSGSSRVLHGELIDHVCCAVEAYMLGGHSFDQALALSIQGFGLHEMKKVSKQVIRTRRYQKLKRQPLGWISPALVVCLLFVVVNVGAKDRPDRKPTIEDFRISSQFGMRLDPFDREKKMHHGIDIVTPMGTPIVATANGTVEKVENFGKEGYGLLIQLKHDEGFQTIYAQLSEAKVKAGDTVTKGDVIGLSGNSGKSTAPHLHYEVIHHGKRVDPSLYFGEAK